MFTRRLTPINDIDSTLLSSLKKHYSIPGGWDSTDADVVDFKDIMKVRLQQNQLNKCAYCELPLGTRSPEIEHIAPKGGVKRPKHTECIFLPMNLVYSCRRCNSPQCKGQRDVVLSKNGSADYSQWTFSIVHPYLDNPSDFFEMNLLQDGRRGPIPLIKRTANEVQKAKARATIQMFKLNSEEVILELAKEFHSEAVPEAISRLITGVSTYKPGG